MAMLEDLEFRKKALDLANFRAKLVEELAEQARAEGDLDETGPVLRLGRTIERFDGAGMFREADFLRISNAFQRQFGKVASGQRQGRHRAASVARFRSPRPRGHRPESGPDGKAPGSAAYLQRARIPYYAFRAAMRGKATAPHIHLGPPSTRYRVAD